VTTFTDWLREKQAADQEHEAALRSQLAALRTRYDHGAIPPCIYTVIYEIEVELGWLQHDRVRP
jgi:hypothetical protein